MNLVTIGVFWFCGVVAFIGGLIQANKLDKKGFIIALLWPADIILHLAKKIKKRN